MFEKYSVKQNAWSESNENYELQKHPSILFFANTVMTDDEIREETEQKYLQHRTLRQGYSYISRLD